MKLESYFDEQWLTSGNMLTYYILPVVLILCLLVIKRLSRSKRNLPKGPTGLPLVGYLPFLGKEPHKVFDKLKEKYGNVFRVRLGLSDVIILADYPAVQDAWSKSASLNRPTGIFDFLPGGFGFGSSNGTQWVEERRFVIKTMRDLGLGKSSWTRLVEEELSDLLEVISSSRGQPLDVFKLLSPSMSNNILSLLFGKKFPGVPDIESLNRSTASLPTFFSPCAYWNFYPAIRTALIKLGPEFFRETLINMNEYHNFFIKEIQKNKETPSHQKDDDFVTQYLETLKNSTGKGKKMVLDEKTLVGDAQSLYFGGTDTTLTSLTWLIIIVAAFPDVQDKLHAELDSVLGSQHRPVWEDRTKFPYVNAVMMEAQRWKTLVPLNTPRMASEDMEILGIDIPKGSVILANNWGLHNDTRYWKNPEKFIPERFLQNGGKEVNLKRESYVPFSLGKRKCPGESVAIMEIFLFFSAVLHLYDIRAPDGKKPNLDGVPGLVYSPQHQSLCFIPRLPI